MRKEANAAALAAAPVPFPMPSFRKAGGVNVSLHTLGAEAAFALQLTATIAKVCLQAKAVGNIWLQYRSKRVREASNFKCQPIVARLPIACGRRGRNGDRA